MPVASCSSLHFVYPFRLADAGAFRTHAEAVRRATWRGRSGEQPLWLLGRDP